MLFLHLIVLCRSTHGTFSRISFAPPPFPPSPSHTHALSQIHGGLLGVRGNAQHESDMLTHGITPIDLVVVNLYAFDATVAKGGDFPTCIENIDIGGPSMLRSSAKNHAAVVVASSPSQYPALLAALAANGGSTPLSLRRAFAAAAYTLTATYDTSISAWFAGQLSSAPATTTAITTTIPPATRTYIPDTLLKYGCNPHQAPAWVGHIAGGSAPFTILNGTPGYINFLDAANAWQLVSELAAATGLPAAASFKHCSPAGAAVGVPLSADDKVVYDIGEEAPPLTPLAAAYLRARQADPLCSYGDFAAVSHVVDEATAMILKTEVSDGLVAPGYEPGALAILKGKKNGAFIVLQAPVGYKPPMEEFREVFGMVMCQKRNDAVISAAGSLDKVVTTGPAFTEEVRLVGRVGGGGAFLTGDGDAVEGI
jgi:phosphoribosylaminoimidazolecarboxamide formyltransferase/IMP cyclohydrolase